MELMIYMSMLSVKFPENANQATSSIITIANFEVPYVNVREALGTISALPEENIASVEGDS